MFSLPDGNGNESNGFKCEWATVKDGHLYVGGLVRVTFNFCDFLGKLIAKRLRF